MCSSFFEPGYLAPNFNLPSADCGQPRRFHQSAPKEQKANSFAGKYYRRFCGHLPRVAFPWLTRLFILVGQGRFSASGSDIFALRYRQCQLHAECERSLHLRSKNKTSDPSNLRLHLHSLFHESSAKAKRFCTEREAFSPICSSTHCPFGGRPNNRSCHAGWYVAGSILPLFPDDGIHHLC